MKTSFLATFFAGLAAVSGAPTKRNNGGGGGGINDAVILQYALTLEHLENAFYRDNLAKYDESAFENAGLDSSVRNRIVNVGSDEQTHVDFLTAGLTAAGADPTKECTYKFPVTDPKSFLAVASVLEGVGVSAYLGAAASIMSKDYLTAAGAILTVEARHSSYIRNVNKLNPFAQPFDVPLDFNQVYSLASQFITSCPDSNPALPVKAFPALTATPVDGGAAAIQGKKVKLTVEDPSILQGKGQIYAQFIGYPESQFGVYSLETQEVWVPVSYQGIAGQSYVLLGTSNDTISDDTTLAGPAIVEIVPDSGSY